MKKKWLGMLVCLLFFGASIVSSINIQMQEVAKSSGGIFLYVGGSGPGNYTKIQDAIDNATSGDTVFVYNGVYYENVIVNKRIDLTGEDKSSTVIDGGGTGDVVHVSADWVTISGFTINNSGSVGISPYDSGIDIRSDNNHIMGNNISNNNYYGIFLYSSSSNNITSNTANNNNIGIYLTSSSNNNNVMGNNASNNNGNGIYLYSFCNHNNVMDNYVSNNIQYGVYLLYYSNNNNVTGNNASNNNRGIFLASSGSNNITGNNVLNNNDGIHLQVSSSNNITGNNASNNFRGILLASSSSNNITGNNVLNNNDGIHLQVSSSNNITGNNASNNNRGIILASSSNNTIYNNYFDNINTNVYDNKQNIWNITKTSGSNIVGGPWLGGNYWSDYTGKDLDGDGLGDTPYNISGGNNKDYLPLTDWENHPPDTPTITGPTNGSAGTEYEYTFTATDPNGDAIAEFIVNWGDGTGNETIAGPSPANASHTWTTQGVYTIQAKAVDPYSAESSWGELQVTIRVQHIPDIPILELVNIEGGILGFSVGLKNFGNKTAYDITWEMTVLDGLLFPNYDSGEISELEPGEEERIPLKWKFGLGRSTIEFRCQYTISIGGTREEFDVSAKQEWNDLGFLIGHAFPEFMQPVKEWKDIESYNYQEDARAQGVLLNFEGINQWHNVRVVKGLDSGNSEVAFLGLCKFTDGEAFIEEGWITRSDIENALAHWEVELVDGQ